jgi:hypothetical protein
MRTRLFLIASIASVLAFGQADDPPGRAARLGYLSGTVSFQPGSVEDWVPATLNRPLSTGDRLWTEAGARAELHLGSAALRLNGRTSFAFLNLNDQMAQIQISQGTLNLRLRRLDEQESFEIDTPQAAFSLLRPGDYRVDVNEQGDTTIVAVRGGEGEVTAGGQASPVHARQQVRIAANENGGPPTFDERDVPAGDAFDNFCQDRDRREDMSESGRHVSRDMPGYADLDGRGVWREVPEYGWVWAPRVEVGWAPYHSGHWAWIAPWGWTWVDDAPWGYAPFHYGRWAFVGGGWIWVPGPVAVRPVYAPALVAWVGGPSFSVGIAVGGGAAVGWFPLGPGELWVPAYRASPRYFNQVNVSNTVVNRTVNITNVYNNVYVNKNTNVTNVNYVNQNVNGAVTAVPQNAMVGGRPVSQAAMHVPPNAVQSAQVQQAAPVAPERAAVLGGRSVTSAAPPAAAMNRAVVARATPPPQAVPFVQQQTALRSNPGRPLDNTALNQIQSSQPPPQRTLIRPAGVPPRSLTPANAQQGGGQFNGQAGGQPQIQRGNNPGQPPAATGAPAPGNCSQQVEQRNVPPQVSRPQQVEPRNVPPQVGRPQQVEPRNTPPQVGRPQLVEPRNAPPQVSRPQSVEQPAGRPAPKQQQQRRIEKGEEKRGEKREEH